MTIASSGVGSATHMTIERFKAATGANITHVPYRSGGALMPDLMGGSVSRDDGIFHRIAAAQGRQGAYHRGRLGASLQLAPDIPTFIEGGVKDFTAQAISASWRRRKRRPKSSTRSQKAFENGLRAAARRRNASSASAPKSPRPSR